MTVSLLEDILEDIFSGPKVLMETSYNQKLEPALRALGIPEESINKIMQAMAGEKDEYESVGIARDKRYKFNQLYGRVERLLHDIGRIHTKCAELGLDKSFRKIFIMGLGGGKEGVKKYQLVRAYGSDDKIDEAIKAEKAKRQQSGTPMTGDEEDALREDMRMKGRVTEDQLWAIIKGLDRYVIPEIERREKQVKAITTKDKTLDDVFRNTNVHGDIEINYKDVVHQVAANGGQPVPKDATAELKSSDPLSVRVKKFGDVLASVEEPLKKEVYGKFLDTYKRVIKALEDSFLPGDENSQQRIFTATQYALAHAAPFLDTKYREERKKYAEEQAKRKADEEAEQKAKEEAERAKAEKAKGFHKQAIDELGGELGGEVPLYKYLNDDLAEKVAQYVTSTGSTNHKRDMNRYAAVLISKRGTTALRDPADYPAIKPKIDAEIKAIADREARKKAREAEKERAANERKAKTAKKGKKPGAGMKRLEEPTEDDALGLANVQVEVAEHGPLEDGIYKLPISANGQPVGAVLFKHNDTLNTLLPHFEILGNDEDVKRAVKHKAEQIIRDRLYTVDDKGVHLGAKKEKPKMEIPEGNDSENIYHTGSKGVDIRNSMKKEFESGATLEDWVKKFPATTKHIGVEIIQKMWARIAQD